MDIKKVPVSKLVFPPVDIALRPAPSEKDKDWADFLEFKKGIEEFGVLNMFSVRENPDGTYMVMDGSRRAMAVIMMTQEGHPRYQDGIEVQVRDESDIESLERMITGNASAKKTPNSQYVKALQRLLIAKSYSVEILAAKLGMTSTWLRDLLGLNFLPPTVQDALDAGKLSVSNAIQLNKLPAEEIDNFTIEALNDTVADFTAKVSQKLNEIAKEKRRPAGAEKIFEPIAKLLKKDELQVNLERARNKAEVEPNDFNRGYLQAYLEVFGLDETSAAAQKAEFELKVKADEESKEKRKAERETKKLKESAEFLASHGIKVEGISIN